MKLKILFAIGRFSVGGAEKLLVHQLRNIDRSKFEPFLLTLFPEQKESLEKEVVLDAEHWKKLYFSSLLDFSSWRELYRFLKKEGFGAAITSLFSANLIVRLAAVLAGVPAIISYEHNLYPDKRCWQIWADWLLAKWTKVILVDAESVKKFTARQEGISEEKFLTLYIPPLLDSKISKNPELVRKELGIPPAAPVAVTVSRLVPEKGHRYLIEAAEKVLEKFPNTYFLIVGWGPLEKSLKLKVESEKLEKNVILTGRMDIKDVLLIADIYVEPALNVDISIALMEAMRTEKAIVATRVGEIPVFIQDSLNGFLAEPANAADLAEKIIKFLESRVLREKFGQRAKETVKNYSLENYMKNFERLIFG